MLHYSRHAVRQAWTSYVGAFVALSLGVVLIGLAVVALQSVDATLLGLGPDQDDAREALDGLTSMLGVMAGMAVFMSLFVVGSTFSFVVASRQRELGLLRLVGATSRQVRLLVGGEAVVVAVVAAIAGCALTLLVGGPALGLLNAYGLTPVPLEMQRSWLPVLVAAPPAIVVALLGSWRSARRAGRATPIDALREAAVERRLVTVTGALVGLIALGAAAAGSLVAARGGPLGALVLSVLLPEVLVVAMMCFGGVLFPALARLVALPFVHRGDAPLLLARDNLLAAPRRTASLAAPVVAIAAIGGSLIVALSLAADWSTAITRTQLVAPVVVENAGPRAAEALATSPAVGLADSGLGTTVRINDEDGVTVEGIDVRAASRTRSLEAVRGSLDSFSGDVVAVSDVMAWDLGWQVGERLQVRWPDGSRGPVRVVALVPEAPDLYPEIIAPRSLVRERDPQARASTYFVLPAPGHAVADVETALAQTGAEVHEAGAWADVRDAEMRRSNQIGLLVVLGPVAVYAGIAIANTLMIGLLQRRREFAALRLIGASQEQLRRMAALESLLVTAAALLLGGMVTVLVGGIVRHATLQVGEVPLSVPWWSLGAVLTACLGTALTATWVAARSITRSPA